MVKRLIYQIKFNTKNIIKFVFAHPIYSFKKTLFNEVFSTDEQELSSILKVNHNKIKRFMKEPFISRIFFQHMLKCNNLLKNKRNVGGGLFRVNVLLQYAIVRSLRPDIVVETGVANGISTCYILFALYNNKKGKLYSIDLNNKICLPYGKETGWMVPNWLNDKWELILDDSKEALPKLFRDLNKIDVFIHDSLHTYDHMMFEFNQAYPQLKENGLLLSDDVTWNNSFYDFVNIINNKNIKVIRSLGIIKK